MSSNKKFVKRHGKKKKSNLDKRIARIAKKTVLKVSEGKANYSLLDHTNVAMQCFHNVPIFIRNLLNTGIGPGDALGVFPINDSRIGDEVYGRNLFIKLRLIYKQVLPNSGIGMTMCRLTLFEHPPDLDLTAALSGYTNVYASYLAIAALKPVMIDQLNRQKIRVVYDKNFSSTVLTHNKFVKISHNMNNRLIKYKSGLVGGSDEPRDFNITLAITFYGTSTALITDNIGAADIYTRFSFRDP